MINPVGSKQLNPLFVEDQSTRDRLIAEASQLPAVLVSSATAANAVMLGGGYFSPLPGFMNLADALGVAENMRTSTGKFFPVPILNLLESAQGIEPGQRIALLDPNVEGNPAVAIQLVEAVEEISDEQMALMTDKIYRTDDREHPGVEEELCHMAMDRLECDGLVIHMLLGKLKPGDIPADVRDDAIRTMVKLYFPENSAMVTGYGFDMLYAGPREAVLHAYFRQNMGATHFIIGRDHAGVGDYYGAFDAQTIFDTEVPAGAMDIEIFRADHTAWSKKLNRVVMMNEAPDHTKDDFVLLSGTRVREMLSEGIAPPKEFSRPEVAKILINYYQSL